MTALREVWVVGMVFGVLLLMAVLSALCAVAWGDDDREERIIRVVAMIVGGALLVSFVLFAGSK